MHCATSATVWRRRSYGVLENDACRRTLYIMAQLHYCAARRATEEEHGVLRTTAWRRRSEVMALLHGNALCGLCTKLGRARRAAEEELCAIGDERDRLAPQVEEARWHARRAEKDAAAARAERDALQTARGPPHSCAPERLVRVLNAKRGCRRRARRARRATDGARPPALMCP